MLQQHAAGVLTTNFPSTRYDSFPRRRLTRLGLRSTKIVKNRANSSRKTYSTTYEYEYELCARRSCVDILVSPTPSTRPARLSAVDRRTPRLVVRKYTTRSGGTANGTHVGRIIYYNQRVHEYLVYRTAIITTFIINN